MSSNAALGQTFIGVDIGGTKCAVSLGRPVISGGKTALEILAKTRFPTQTENGPERALQRLEEAIEQLLGQTRVAAIGVSCGGPLDSARGLILSPPNLPGWDAIAVVERFSRRFGVPVALQNDANACALAEWEFGAGQGLSNLVFLTFGTGMGAGLILNDRLYSGSNDLAGEVGHIRLAEQGPRGYGKAGSFEGFCSGGGIARLAGQLIEQEWRMGKKVDFCASPTDLETLTTEQIAGAALRGDPVALEVFRVSGHYLGRGLALLIDLLNPQAIIIGSIFTRQRDLLWPTVQAVLEAEALPVARQACRILPAGLGENVGDYASLAVAINHIKSNPVMDKATR